MSLLEEIVLGKHDDNLEKIANAITQRRKARQNKVASLNMVSLKKGDQVILKSLSPKSINGTKCEVVRKNRTRIVVKTLEPSFGVGRGNLVVGELLTVPASCLEKIGGTQ
jgi:hypothetical protein